ncbi:MAG: hypothetical protein K5772_05735 [Clostridia bacterium]|nr:hypothetical protein [Clostridia bacterium]
MLLDEIREKIEIKKELVLADPDEKEENKKFLVTSEKLFQNRDAILKCPRSVILGLLMYVGYPHSEIRTVYDNLISELNRVYVMIDPDSLDEMLK